MSWKSQKPTHHNQEWMTKYNFSNLTPVQGLECPLTQTGTQHGGTFFRKSYDQTTNIQKVFRAMITSSVKSRGQISSIERGTEVAISITTIAPKAIVGTIAIAQATEATKAIVVAIVVAHGQQLGTRYDVEGGVPQNVICYPGLLYFHSAGFTNHMKGISIFLQVTAENQ